jgi:phosphatidylserine synthase
MTCAAVHPDPTSWEEKVGESAPVIIDIRPLGNPEAASFVYVGASNKVAMIYSELISVDELRMRRLKKNRMGFAIATLVMLAALLTALFINIPYEPFAALFFCLMGLFVVFAMKIHDAKR